MASPIEQYVVVPPNSYLEVLQSRYGASFQWLNAEEKLALLNAVVAQIVERRIESKGSDAVTEGVKFIEGIANTLRQESLPSLSLLGLAEAMINHLKEEFSSQDSVKPEAF